MAFKNVTSHTNCLESSERCRSNPVSCVPEQVRFRIESLVNRKDFHFIEDGQKHSLPYGCYLSLVPVVPYGDTCYPCAKFCNLTAKTAEEDTNTKGKMCQLYCWEDRVRCTTTLATMDANTETTGDSKIPESKLPEPTSTPPRKDSSWRAWEKKVPQAVPWSALVIGLTTLVGYLGFFVYLWISDWRRRATAGREPSVPSETTSEAEL